MLLKYVLILFLKGSRYLECSFALNIKGKKVNLENPLHVTQ